MISDFWIGTLFGFLVGGTLGALAMAIMAAAGDADAHIERMAADGIRGGGSVGVGNRVAGDAGGNSVDRSALEAAGKK